MRYLLLLPLLVAGAFCQPEGDRGVDSTATKFIYPNHYYEWNSAAPTYVIKDEDRPTPARHRPEWIEWRKAYGSARKYLNAMDEELHARVFEESELLVADHNEAFAKGESTYELGINQFADMTREEFAKYRMSEAAVKVSDQFFASLNGTLNPASSHSISSRVKRSPSSYDWRQHIPFTPPKDQTGCGSCYAFAAIAAIEAQFAKKTGKTVDLSDQFIVDCTINYKDGQNNGCAGGLMHIAYDWLVANNRSIRTTATYPYKKKVGSCPASNSQESYKIKGFKNVGRPTENKLQEFVVNNGPIACAMDADHRDFAMYKRGIYNSAACTKNVNHAIVAIGYGSEAGKDYWIIRNSWSTNWGERGYGKIARGVNQCGFPFIATWPQI